MHRPLYSKTHVIWIGITYLNGRFFIITNGHITEFSKIVVNVDCSTTTSIVMFKHAKKFNAIYVNIYTYTYITAISMCEVDTDSYNNIKSYTYGTYTLLL